MNEEIPILKFITEISMGPFGSDIKVDNFISDGIPVLNGSNLCDYKLNENSFKYVSKDKANTLGRANAERGDIIITHRGTLGQVSYIPENSKFARYVISQSQFRVRFNNKINPIYLTFLLHTQYGQKKLLSFKNHVGVPALAQATTNFKLLRLRLHNKREQDNIAYILSLLDTKIENNNHISNELDSLAKTIYEYWFVQFDFPDKKGRPYKSSGGKMVWSEELKREIPMGWEVVELRKYLTYNRGVSYSGKDITGGGIPMINLNSFTVNGTYKIDGTKTYSGEYKVSKALKPFDLVMCNTQQTALDPLKDIIGKSFLVPDIFNTDIVSSHHVTTIQVKGTNIKFYLNTLFNTTYFHRYISGYATGTNILGLDFEGVLSYKTEIPAHDLLNKYADLIVNFEKQKSIILKENQELTSLRDWLLPMLMNGQVKLRGAYEKRVENLSIAADKKGKYQKKVF